MNAGKSRNPIVQKPAMLEDRYGLWCGWCLKYIASTETEKHHVYPTWATDRLCRAFPNELGWTIPVHKDNCHRRNIQHISDAAGDTLIRTGGLPSVPQLNIAAEAAWRKGNINLSVWLRLRASFNSGDPSEAHRLRVMALSSAAGSRTAAAFMRHLLRAEGSEMHRRLVQAKDSALLNYASNLYSAVGDFDEAQRCISAARDAMGRMKHRRPGWLTQSVARRELVICYELGDARETLGLARAWGDPYPLRSSMIMSGWAKLRAHDYTGARDDFESLHEIVTTPPVSWWHRMEALRGGACAIYLGERRSPAAARVAAARLQAAQYILVMLGLLGLAVPDVRRPAPVLLADILPSELLAWIMQSHEKVLTADALYEMRKVFIAGDMRDGVLEVLKLPTMA